MKKIRMADTGFSQGKCLFWIFMAIFLPLLGFGHPALADWADSVKQGIISQNPLVTPEISSMADGLDTTISWTDVPDATGYTLYFTPASKSSASPQSFLFGAGETSGTFRWSEGDVFDVSVEAYSASGRKSALSDIESVSIPVYGESDINGSVYLYEPVSGATVCVATGYSEDTDTCAETDANGTWQGLHVDVLVPPVRIEVRNGQEGELPFGGAMSAYLPYNDVVESDNFELDADSQVSVNVLTTIIDRYMLKTGVDYGTAVKQVLQFFGVPEDIDVFSRETWEQYFSPAEFTARCITEENGNFDLYVDSLVGRIGGGETENMTPGNGLDGMGFGKQVVNVGFGSWAGEMALGALGGVVFKTGLNLLLPALGADTTDSHLQDIRNNLQNIRDKLGELQAEVTQISENLTNLSKQLDIIADKLISKMTKIELTSPRARINTHFGTMINYSSGSPTDIEILALANKINATIDTDVGFINEAMVSETGALVAMYEYLVQRLRSVGYENRGSELAFCYNELQSYFSDLVALQLKGSLLYINACGYLFGPASVTAKGHMETLQAYLDQEVEVFLSLVERLVVASADVRTIMYGDYSMFPDEVEEIFFHADFIAQQLSTKHTAGFVIRILGDPAIAGKFYHAKQHGTFKGKPVKRPEGFYPAAIPKYYGTEYYLGWDKQDGTWIFNSENKIAIHKLTYPDPYAGSTPRKIPSTHTLSYLDGQFKAVGRLGYFDTDGNQTDAGAEGGTLYGNAVLCARYSPQFESSHIRSKNKHGEWDTYFAQRGAAAAGRLSMKYVIKERYRDWNGWGSPPPLPYANSEMSISTRLRNGETSKQELELDLQMEDSVCDNGFSYVFSYDFSALRFFYDWRISLDEKNLLKVEEKNWEKIFGGYRINWYHQTEERVRNHTKSFSLDGSKESSFAFASDQNAVALGGTEAVYGKDDTGSKVTFTHQIKKLELIPRP